VIELIQYNEIKKYKKYIPLDLNNNSKLYYDKEIIYKIPNYMNIEFKKILEYIYNLNIEDLIKLKNIVYKGDKLVGYSFINYKEYKSLRRLKNRNLELKKQDCIKIIKDYDLLAQNNLKYSDFHLGNVLLNNKTNDIKICDLDGFSLVGDRNISKNQLRNSTILALAYLYNINYYDVRNVVNNRGLEYDNYFINNFKNINNMNINDVIDLINNINEKSILDERLKIVNKSKQLCKTGYSKYVCY